MRQPKQIHVYLYRERNGIYEYAVFQRSDMPICWQGVCGGLENNETLEEGLMRELSEEAGISKIDKLIQLESICHLPDNLFAENWDKSVVMVPMYYYAIPYDGEITLSDEHLEVKWLDYETAVELVYFDSQKNALYELNEKLKRGLI